jgi:hypothetical protein
VAVGNVEGWVTTDAYERGCYTKLYDALIRWITAAFPLTSG